MLNEQLEGQENTIDSLKLSLSKLHKEHDKLVVEHDSASMEVPDGARPLSRAAIRII